MQTHYFPDYLGVCQSHMSAEPRPVLRHDIGSGVGGKNRLGFYRLALSAVVPLPSSDSVFDLKREGPRPLSGPSNPDPGPIAGERGAVARPRSGLRGGTCDLGVTLRAPWLIHPSQELSRAGVMPDDPEGAA